MASGFSYNGSLLALRQAQGDNTSKRDKDVMVSKPALSRVEGSNPRKRIRGIFRFEATPLLFADVDADFYLDIKQAAQELDVTERSIARYRVAKQLPTHSLGERKNLFRKSVIDKIKNAI